MRFFINLKDIIWGTAPQYPYLRTPIWNLGLYYYIGKRVFPMIMPLEKIADFSITKLSILDEQGNVDTRLEPTLSASQLVDLYKHMILLRAFDSKALKLQRQGRIGTYASSLGQEACTVGSAYALQKQDWTFPAFREHGMFFVRGVSIVNVLQYWGGDERGSRVPNEINVFPVSIPVGSHMVHAVGCAMAMKYKKKDAVAMTYFSDGATSEGDFHEAMNFAAAFDAPCVFVCQNNQYAISVSRNRQTRSQTLAQKAVAYGMEGLQVDGNDVLATYVASKEAVEKARNGKGPTFLEFYTYRMGDHTTADDSTRYRAQEEVDAWRKKDPIERFRKYLYGKGILTSVKETQIQEDATAKVEEAVADYESIPAPSPEDLFDYLYKEMPPDLAEQKRAYLAHRAALKTKETISPSTPKPEGSFP